MTGRIIIDELDLERARREKEQKPRKCDRLTTFFYLLLRDSLTIGEIEQIMQDLGDDETNICSNGWLVDYARDLVKRLKGGME